MGNVISINRVWRGGSSAVSLDIYSATVVVRGGRIKMLSQIDIGRRLLVQGAIVVKRSGEIMTCRN
uniref:Uncharacterized protein n=1 Tax=Hyaloperonospora arabidopsidis (strain Emoy2) TaxID=559515 RepID=M4BRD3_HYAAE